MAPQKMIMEIEPIKRKVKIFVVGYYNRFPSITDSVADALRRLGHEVMVYQLYSPIGKMMLGNTPVTLLPRLPYSKSTATKNIVSKTGDFKPDIMFILRGDELDSNVILDAQKKYQFHLWQWMYDPITLTPEAIRMSEHCDRIFHYSAEDTKKLKDLFPQKDIAYMPGAYDDRFHNPASEKLFQRELFFCGALGGERYRNRRECLNRISEINATKKHGYKFTFAVRPTNFNILKLLKFSKMLRTGYPFLFSNWVAQNHSRISLVSEYHKSKLSLNLHSSFSEGVGLSWRTFELIGSQSCFISDMHPELDDLFQNDSFKLPRFSNPDELFDLIEKIILDESYQKRFKKYLKSIRERHSYYARFQTIFTDV